ncbi:xanthine dehydrogenase family protein subunit M [Candidatus Bipolaricaulota bacterium]|nr:xanthine dehydrogenase family protein subunit M [Candidatus Bipolaricaulota bacterium]
MRYQRVVNEKELLESLAEPGATILCGGTDVMIKMRAGMMQPSALIDVSQLDSMQGIRLDESTLIIGAATTESDIHKSPLVREHVPLLSTVLAKLGSVQIRNRGSLGGNLVNASPAADGAIPLLLFDTEIELVSAKGIRWIKLEDFFTGPGRTVLAHGEFVRSLRLAIPNAGYGSFYHKVGRRNALTIAIASLGMLLWIEEHVIREIRMAVGSVAPTARRLRAIENQLTGRLLNDATLDAARQLITDAISPISDVRASASYRKNVIGDLLVRALGASLH